ncbi:MAG TPA: sodium:solute symporter, partial [Catalimonadaceae bacterium]|nr:sodium:solute symporter [Catalimonadaceae bacterium]
YGPLLGMYALGLLLKTKPMDNLVPLVAVLSVVISYLLKSYSKTIFNGYEIGFEILLINGAITMLLLGFTSWIKPKSKT